jgi:hypothetical protein
MSQSDMAVIARAPMRICRIDLFFRTRSPIQVLYFQGEYGRSQIATMVRPHNVKICFGDRRRARKKERGREKRGRRRATKGETGEGDRKGCQ